MKKKKYKWLYLLLRMDNFNRLTVFIFLVVCLIEPSIILYSMTESNYSLSLSISCLCVLGIDIGIGLFTLHKPIRTTWFYFLSCLFGLLSNANSFLHPSNIPYLEEHNLAGIFYTEIVLASICLIINLIFFAKSFYKYQKSKTMTSEKTNMDSPYDFLNGGDINKDIEIKIRQMDENNSMVSRIKAVKLSRTARIFSFIALTLVIIYFYLNSGDIKNLPMSELLLVISFLAPISFISSLFFPGDFKYIYYYVVILFTVMMILGSHGNVYMRLLIIVLIFHGLSMLLTLITEGRTWTGGPID